MSIEGISSTEHSVYTNISAFYIISFNFSEKLNFEFSIAVSYIYSNGKKYTLDSLWIYVMYTFHFPNWFTGINKLLKYYFYSVSYSCKALAHFGRFPCNFSLQFSALRPWQGANKCCQQWHLVCFGWGKVTEATPCCAYWRSCLWKTDSSPCSSSTKGCWRWRALWEHNDHTTKLPEHSHGTGGCKHTQTCCQEMHRQLKNYYFFLPISDARCSRLPVCWKKSRWWGCTLGWS